MWEGGGKRGKIFLCCFYIIFNLEMGRRPVSFTISNKVDS
jgi:hypothetical protein